MQFQRSSVARALGFATAFIAACGLQAARAGEGDSIDVALVDASQLRASQSAVRAAPPAGAEARVAGKADSSAGLRLPVLPELRAAISGFGELCQRAAEAGAAALSARQQRIAAGPVAAAARSAGFVLPPGLSSSERQWLEQYYLPLPALGSTYGVYSSADEQGEADVVFKLLNQHRASKRAPLLVRDAHLDAVAQAHALHMARAGFFEHQSPLGMEVYERINAAGAPSWRAAGENIAAGQRSGQEAEDTWMRSKGHRHNILGEQYERVGIGAAYVPGSEYGWYWVQVFATYDGRAEARWLEPSGAALSGVSGSASLPPESGDAPPPLRQMQPQRYYPSQRSRDDGDRDNGACMTGG